MGPLGDHQLHGPRGGGAWRRPSGIRQDEWQWAVRSCAEGVQCPHQGYCVRCSVTSLGLTCRGGLQRSRPQCHIVQMIDAAGTNSRTLLPDRRGLVSAQAVGYCQEVRCLQANVNKLVNGSDSESEIQSKFSSGWQIWHRMKM